MRAREYHHRAREYRECTITYAEEETRVEFAAAFYARRERVVALL